MAKSPASIASKSYREAKAIYEGRVQDVRSRKPSQARTEYLAYALKDFAEQVGINAAADADDEGVDLAAVLAVIEKKYPDVAAVAIPEARRWSQRLRGNPLHNNPRAVAAHYEEFHGTEPSAIETGRLWVPGALLTLGPAVDVGYGIVEDDSVKDGMYVHDFEAGVKLLARPKAGEQADTSWRGAFPTELMVLGDWLGCTYQDGDEEVELRGPRGTRLCVTPNRNVLVVVHVSQGVQYVFRGGKMRVDDWIYR